MVHVCEGVDFGGGRLNVNVEGKGFGVKKDTRTR